MRNQWRALRCAGVVAIACAGAGLVALPAGAARSAVAVAVAVRCPNQDLAVTATDAPQVSAAIQCVINSVRAEYGLPALVDSQALDEQAKSHPLTSAPLGSDWGISDVVADGDGDVTAYAAVSRWMATRGDPSCTLILGPVTDVGVGIVNHAVLGPRLRGAQQFAMAPTWTLELAQSIPPPQSSTEPNFSAANSCPHPLPTDPAGQGGPTPAPPPVSVGPADVVGQAVSGLKGQAVTFDVGCAVPAPQRCAATIGVTLLGGGSGASRTVHVRAKTKYGIVANVPFAAAPLKRARDQKAPTVQLSVQLTKPARPMVLFEEPLGALHAQLVEPQLGGVVTVHTVTANAAAR